MKKLLPVLLMTVLLAIMAAGCTAEDAVGAGFSVFMFVCWGILAIIGLLLYIPYSFLEGVEEPPRLERWND